MTEPEFDDELERRPSKSQIKRECAALEDLGEELIRLPKERLNRMDLPEDLREAIRQAQAITSHVALKRQRKFVGKLLRSVDAEPIRRTMEHIQQQSALGARTQHQIEAWRDRLLSGADGAVNAFLETYPQADRQKLRQLVRDSEREKTQQTPPRSARLLFKYIRDFLAAAPVDTEETE